ncbi:hypothetical protein BGZ50_007079 [Haplosporangium sp. Z 11]|nr:hypothetical protein BGZ50_007079 [Haplosporangium sp. Z 11]
MPLPPLGLGLNLSSVNGISDIQEPSSELISSWTAPVSGPSYFDITPSSITSSSNTKKSSAYTTKTPGRRAKRTPAHSISSTITNGGSTTPRRVSCTNMETASQNSTSYLDDQDLEIDENSFYIHLKKMQERYQAQQEPGWLRTQHALLQAKHRIPGSGSHYQDSRNAFGGKKSGFGSGSQPFFSRIHSGNSSPSTNDYSSSPSFHPSLQPRQSYLETTASQRHQPIQPYNCFQPGNVICVPRERSLGGLVFHKTFVDTHILTPSPYYRGQYLTLDHKVVEIDKEYVREISGFAHPRSVQILTEETVYNGPSQKPTRVLILERPLEGDGVVRTRPTDGPVMPTTRILASDMAFLESFPELGRALRDFNSLCQEFENTYVYIRGFAAYTLDKLRLIYEKAYRDCVGDSVKLQKMLLRGVQAEQDCFAELIENIVLGKLYKKLFILSLVPCYTQRDAEVDETIARYHRYLFSLGGHRGIDGGTCLVSTEGPLLQETLRKLGLSEKLQSLRVDHALERAAGLFQAWDQETLDDSTGSDSSACQKNSNVYSPQETEQERKRRQLRESLRVFVQENKPKSEKRSSITGLPSRENDNSNENDEYEEEDPTANAVWNTPLEKVYSIKLVLDIIATVAEDHLMYDQGVGFVQKKRSEVCVTTDDLIPLLAIVIIQARMMRLGSNLFYLQNFRINTPKPDLNFALVTFEASIEFLKTDPLGIMNSDQTRPPSSVGIHSPSDESLAGSNPRIDIDSKSPTDEDQVMPWGTPSHTGWGFSPPKASSFTPSIDLIPPGPETNVPNGLSAGSPPSRPPLIMRPSYYSQQHQQRHNRSTSVNFDDRLRRMAQAEEVGGGSSSNSSWSRSPMLGPRYTSGASSPLGIANSSYGTGFHLSETAPGTPSRRQSYQFQHTPQRHSISSGQINSHLHHRISIDQGRETMHRSTILPLPSPSMSPHLVVKPQIMLPPPKTPPMSGQKTSSRTRPMSMIVVGALASSACSSSYGGSSATTTRNRAYSSNTSSPATSPRLGPGTGGRPSGARANSLMSDSFPMMRANSMTAVPKPSGESLKSTAAKKSAETTESLSPISPSSSWMTQSHAKSAHSSQSLALSPSPLLLTESAVLAPESAITCAAALRSPEPTKMSRSSSRAPSRIRTSPSATTSSISTPTTPSTFSPTSSNALLDSLSVSAQLACPSVPGSGSMRSKTLPPSTSQSSISSGASSASGSVRSKRASICGHDSLRLSLPKLALSPSAPSTAFTKATVTAATHATNIEDNMALTTDLVKSPATSISPIAVVGAKSTPEVPTLSSLGRSGSHTRARSPAISMAISPFALSDFAKNASPSARVHSPLKDRQEELTLSPTDDAEHLETSEPVPCPEAESSCSTDEKEVTSSPSAPQEPIAQKPTRLSSKTASNTVSASSSSPSYAQQHSQFIGRRSAPEIISLASPLTGDIVNRTSIDEKACASSYTPSIYDQHLRSDSHVSGNSFLARRSLDVPRPSTSLGCYGTSGNDNSPRPGSVHQFGQSFGTLSPNPIQPPQLSLSSFAGKYHRQHDRQQMESTTLGSVESPMSSSFSHHAEVGPRGLGIHVSNGNKGGFEGDLAIKEIRSLKSQQSRAGSPWSTSSIPPTIATNITVSKMEQQGQVSSDPWGERTRPANTSSRVHVKMDSGKFVGHHGSNSSSTSSTSSIAVDSHHHHHHHHHHYHHFGVANRSSLDHVRHGTAQEFELGFGNDLVSDTPVSNSRRGSATSFKNAKSVGALPWSVAVGVQGADLASSASYMRPNTLGTGSETPMSGSFSGMVDDNQQRTRRMMMGDFLSELANVKDGDVLVGNGRSGVMGRQ